MPFRVATYNAGLAVGLLPHVTERLPRVVDALATLDVDLLFVQELWLDEHWEAVRRAVASRLPHAFRPPAARETGARGASSRAEAPSPACREADVAPLVECARAHCAGLRDEPLARCVVARCAAHGLALPTRCLNCIAADPTGSLEEIVGRCVDRAAPTGGSPAVAEPDRGSRYGGLIAYGGSHGTGLLSATPLERPQVLAYASTINARCAVHARVAGPGGRATHVFATHFSPGGAEHPVQVADLLAWIEHEAPRARGEPAILLGDLNTSPGSSAFRALERAGFREPDAPDRRGTFGGGLDGGRVLDDGWRIDHVLTRDVGGHVASRRIFDAPITLAGGVRTTLSDHFGVLATIDDPPAT